MQEFKGQQSAAAKRKAEEPTTTYGCECALGLGLSVFASTAGLHCSPLASH